MLKCLIAKLLNLKHILVINGVYNQNEKGRDKMKGAGYLIIMTGIAVIMAYLPESAGWFSQALLYVAGTLATLRTITLSGD